MYSKAQRKYPPEHAINPYTEADDAPTFYDSEGFKAYCRLITETVIAAGRPVSIREIHDRLGPERTIRRWTMDALDASSLKHTAGFIDRWSASVAEGRTK